MQFYSTESEDFDILQARNREKKALWINASKLGALLIIYNLLSSLMVIIYYYLVYAYMNHGFTLSYAKVLTYLSGEKELIASSMFSMLGNLFSVFFTLAITMLIGIFIMKIDLSSMLKPDKKHVKQAAVWLPACMAINSIVSVIAAMFTAFMGRNGITVPEIDFSLTKPGALEVTLQIAYVIVIGPIAEEIIYRGVVLSLLKPFGKSLAVVISALLFGLMHGNIPQALAAVAGALMYGLIAVKFDSIIPTILIHITNNLLASYPDYKDAYALPMWIYYGVMIILSLAGVYVIFTKITELRINHESPCILTSGQKYRVVFTNVFMIFYLLMLLSVFVRTFYYANM